MFSTPKTCTWLLLAFGANPKATSALTWDIVPENASALLPGPGNSTLEDFLGGNTTGNGTLPTSTRPPISEYEYNPDAGHCVDFPEIAQVCGLACVGDFIQIWQDSNVTADTAQELLGPVQDSLAELYPNDCEVTIQSNVTSDQWNDASWSTLYMFDGTSVSMPPSECERPHPILVVCGTCREAARQPEVLEALVTSPQSVMDVMNQYEMDLREQNMTTTAFNDCELVIERVSKSNTWPPFLRSSTVGKQAPDVLRWRVP